MAWNPQQQYQRPQRGGFSFFPPAIKFLLVSNVAIFLAELLFGSFHTAGSESLSATIEQYFSLWPIGSGHFYPWQFISYMFLHEGFGHIFMNMLVLWMFGVEVEHTMGTKKFLTYYFICGLGGGVTHLIISSMLGSEQGPLLGASGAIFGILVAFGLMFPNRSVYFFPLIFFPIPAKYFVGGYIAVELWMTASSNDNVSHLAHLGGAVTGILFLLISTGGKIFAMRKQSPPNPVSWNGGGAPTVKPPANPFRGMGGGMFKGPRGQNPVDAEYHDIEAQNAARNATATDVKQSRVITQEEIDRILDKIAASGYQNLTTDERDILFEASRRMEQGR